MLHAARAGMIAAPVLLLALLAAWQLPPLLDWARYRQAIAALAASRLERPVAIGGQVHLTLLPQPELTAQNVTLADRGDGISARIGALRLKVALWPLLRGHLVPLNLALDAPDITVPWPLPRVPVSVVPSVASGFTAHVDGGTLHLGGLTPGAIDGDMHVDPDTGAFASTGTARLDGRMVRFDAIIGAPGHDGVASLSLSLDGQGQLHGAGAGFTGRISADGALQGSLRASGSDLSRLMAAPALPWRVQGPVRIAGGMVHAPYLLLVLGASPGHASVTMQLAPARLEAIVHVGQVELGAWALQAARARSALPAHLDISTEAATLAGGIIRDPHVAIAMMPSATRVETIKATLPGGAGLQLAGALEGGTFAGDLHLAVPDPQATLDWVHDALPAFPEMRLGEANRPVTIDGDLHVTEKNIALKNMRAEVGGTAVGGEIDVTRGTRPALRLDLQTDNLNGAAWLVALPAHRKTAASAFANLDASLHLRVARWALPDLAFSQVVVSAHGDAHGIAMESLAADIVGAHVQASGSLAPDGTIADAKLDLDAVDAASLPAAWRPIAGLWSGPLHMALTAAGPSQAVGMQLRCDLGDIRAEVESVLDTEAPALTATMTLRHPGAPRLLALAGVAGAGRWIEQGSVALIAHVSATPGYIEARDFSVAAAALHLTGTANIDLSDAVPTITGTIDAPSLTVPSINPRAETLLPFGLLAGWQGHLHLKAAHIVSDLRPVASAMSTDVTVVGGVLLADDVTAEIAGGRLNGAAALDSSAGMLAMRATLNGVNLADLGVMPAWQWSRGTADLAGDMTFTGHSAAAFLASAGGTAQGALHGASLQGINLSRVRMLLNTRPSKLRASLGAATATGETGPLSGTLSATADHGAVDFNARDLAADAGRVDIAGTLDLPARTEDVTVRAYPALAAPPAVSVRVVGDWQMPRRVVDLADGLAWAGVGRRK